MALKVRNWMTNFGLFTPSKAMKRSNEIIKLCYKLIEEEADETLEAIRHYLLVQSKENLMKLLFELGDLIWVCHYMLYSIGVDPLEVEDAIYKANMSKVCKTEAEAKETVKAYREGTHPLKIGKKIDAYYTMINGRYIIKDNSTDKILKSINTRKPELNIDLSNSD